MAVDAQSDAGGGGAQQIRLWLQECDVSSKCFSVGINVDKPGLWGQRFIIQRGGDSDQIKALTNIN